ncbi:MAG TPA: hypothetical protein VLH77_04400 [Gammaproteobacteria bacterium]|nr:hypothetical protein [Gammaproteobacteria bacterium]
MKKLSLLSISLLMAGNACAMDAEESAEQPHSPRTSFLLGKLNDTLSPGYAIVTQKLLAEQLAILAECAHNLLSGFMNLDEFRSRVASIKSTMPPHSQVELLTTLLKHDTTKRSLLFEVIGAEEEALQDNLSAAEFAFTQARGALAQACSDAYHTGVVPEAFDTQMNTVAEQGALIRQLNERIAQLEELRKL